MSYDPAFVITPKIAGILMEIAAQRENINNMPISPGTVKTLRDEARRRSVFHSAGLSGLNVSPDEIERVTRRRGNFSVRERGEKEITGYFNALEWMENNADRPLTENAIRRVNAIVLGGDTTRLSPSPFRERASTSVSGLIELLEKAEGEIPIPIAAAIAHHAIAAISPFNEGNMRTARIISTMILCRGGFGLNGFYSLEEQYGANPEKYLETLKIHPEEKTDQRQSYEITPWIEYFVLSMSRAFAEAKERVGREMSSDAWDRSALFRSLLPRQRKVLELFADRDVITSRDVETLLSFSARSARLLCQKLAAEGFLVAVNKADKTRNYKLGEKFTAAAQ